ncbi:MAG: hypothetical protein ACFFCQ_16250 [Promethearchaeota archaeon]
METLLDTDISLIWGNLRNLIDFNSKKIPREIWLADSTTGEFPINSFHPIFLEIPRSHKKIDISGRSNTPFRRKSTINWFHRRIVTLPIYETSDQMDIKCLESIVLSWERALIPEDIPWLALAFSCVGQYSNMREAQYLVVLLLWANHVARILELEWFEGPLEDCITPEWYISSSELMNPQTAFLKLKDRCLQAINWINPSFTIYTIPSCLGSSFQGKRRENNRKDWKYEWIYNDHRVALTDLEVVLEKVEEIIT